MANAIFTQQKHFLFLLERAADAPDSWSRKNKMALSIKAAFLFSVKLIKLPFFNYSVLGWEQAWQIPSQILPDESPETTRTWWLFRRRRRTVHARRAFRKTYRVYYVTAVCRLAKLELFVQLLHVTVRPVSEPMQLIGFHCDFIPFNFQWFNLCLLVWLQITEQRCPTSMSEVQ